MQSFNILAILCSCADLFESYIVGNIEDRFSYDNVHLMAQITSNSRVAECRTRAVRTKIDVLT